MTVIDIDDARRICLRCGFDLPLTAFPLGPYAGRRLTCRACMPGEPLVLRVASIAATATLKCVAVEALIAMGLTVAARRILTGARWPRMPQARAMQMRTAVPRPR